MGVGKKDEKNLVENFPSPYREYHKKIHHTIFLFSRGVQVNLPGYTLLRPWYQFYINKHNYELQRTAYFK